MLDLFVLVNENERNETRRWAVKRVRKVLRMREGWKVEGGAVYGNGGNEDICERGK